MYALLRVLGGLSLTFSVFAVASAEPTDKEEIAPGYFYEKLRKLEFEDVKDLGDDFKALYRPNVSRTMKWKGIEISAEEFALGDPNDDLPLRGAHFLPDGILILKAKDKQTVLPIDWAANAKNRTYLIGEVPEPVLCIDNGSRGNGWNANPSYIVSLADGTFLQNLGSIGAHSESKDEEVELMRIEDVWEGRLPWLSHASSPMAIIYYRVKDGRLEPDPERNEQAWKAEIIQLDREIVELHEGVTKAPHAKVALGAVPDNRNQNLLETILDKFLNERLLVGIEKAWANLQAELRHADDTDFYWAAKERAGYTVYRYPIREIESVLMETLKKSGYLDKKEDTLPTPIS